MRLYNDVNGMDNFNESKYPTDSNLLCSGCTFV